MHRTVTPRGRNSAERTIAQRMSQPVHSVGPDDWLTDAEAQLLRHEVSQLPVLNGRGHVCGTIGRVELLRAGRVRVVRGGPEPLLSLPQARVREFMRTQVEVAAPESPLREAARRMVRQRLRQLLVVRDSKLLGVLSVSDLASVVEERQVTTPLAWLMSPSVVSVRSFDSLRTATDRLEATDHEGIVVLDAEWPVGIFTRCQALAAREAPSELAVERWMDPRVLCLPLGAPAGYAAGRMRAAGVDHIVVTDEDRPCGIVTSVDFAKLVADRSDG
jgi:CBS domain-containing protein